MQSKLKQLSLADVYTDIDEYFQQDKPNFMVKFKIETILKSHRV